MTFQATASVATTRASRYMEQMLKHFGHKLPVTRGEGTGTVPFSAGNATFAAAQDELLITVDAPTAEGCATVEDIVTRHLVRFAFREELTLAWRRQPG